MIGSPFAGEIALVTGAASGIGRATAEAFLRAGAAVVGLDVDERIAERDDQAFLGVPCDVTDEAAVDAALDLAVEALSRVGRLPLRNSILAQP